uniref:Uncharacterized protein n=1 Tax=Arundo donax TaxID=35708 RepID=A0A0A9A276_ARUDO
MIDSVLMKRQDEGEAPAAPMPLAAVELLDVGVVRVAMDEEVGVGDASEVDWGKLEWRWLVEER